MTFYMHILGLVKYSYESKVRIGLCSGLNWGKTTPPPNFYNFLIIKEERGVYSDLKQYMLKCLFV